MVEYIEIVAENLAQLDDQGMIPQALKETYAARHGTKFDPVLECRKHNQLHRRLQLEKVLIKVCLGITLALLSVVLVLVCVLDHKSMANLMIGPIILLMLCWWRFCCITIRERYFSDEVHHEVHHFAIALECLVSKSGLSLEELNLMSKGSLEAEVSCILTRLAGDVLEVQSENQSEFKDERGMKKVKLAFVQTFDLVKHLGLIPETRGYGPYYEKAKELQAQVG